MDQKFSNFIGRQAYVVCFVPQDTDTVVLYIYIASRQIASTATVATAKEYSAATAKIKRIIWGASSPTAAPIVVLRRFYYRTCFVDASATRLLRTLTATSIAK